MKKFSICVALIAVAIIGCGVVYARIIPGVDEPFDPPNYYSPTSISYPDSAPSVFTMRDLAGQGGSVFDYVRNTKEILAVENKTNWAKVVFEILGIEIIDSTPINLKVVNTIRTGTDVLNNSVTNSWRTNETNNFFNNKYFRDFDKYNNDGTEDYDPLKQCEEVEKIYKSYAEALDEIRKIEAEEEKLINTIQEASETAQGEMELNQLQAQLEAVQSSLNKKKNVLLGLYIDLKSAENKIKSDEALEQARIVQEAELIIEDPYDRSDLSKQQYQKPEPIGFITMK